MSFITLHRTDIRPRPCLWGSDVMPWTVVDSVGAVRGIDGGLRVVDASIIPQVPSTVTKLTVIMIAERIFDRVYR
jgi:choline dehydrogenase